jgi:phenylacetate-CoA ligase
MSLRHRLEFAATVHRVKTVPGWSTQRIAALREQRLRSLLKTAVERSPFYQRRYRGLNIATVPLTELPPVTKDDLRDHWDDVVTDRALRHDEINAFVLDDANLGKWYLGRYAVCHTSGSQGLPLVIVQDRACLNVIFALLASRCSAKGPPSLAEAFRRILRPKRVAAISFRRGPYPSGMLLEFMGEVLGRFVEVKRFSSLLPDLAQHLEEFNPDSITGYASVLEALAIANPPPKLPRLEQLTNSSEYVPDRARRRIEAGFHAPLFDHYGTGECLQLADGCPHCGHLHVNDDWAILESVDELGRPVPPGVTGDKVFVTNLANHVQPFIRYEVGDRVAMAIEPCPVRRLTKLESIEGRSSEAFPVTNGVERRLLPGIVFHAALDAIGAVRDWQVVHKGPDRVEIRVWPLPGEVTDQISFDRLLREHLAVNELPPWVHVDIRLIDRLDPNAQTGKMQRYIREYRGN